MTTIPSQPNPTPTQPSYSKITVVSVPDNLTFTVPPTGFFGGMAFVVLLFAIASNAVTIVLTIYFAINLHAHPGWPTLVPLLAAIPFVAVSFFFALLAVQTAKQKSILSAARSSLSFTQDGPFRKAKREWPISQLKSIRVGPSNLKIKKNVLLELQVRTIDNKYHSFFTGRPDPELHWLAATLINFYNVPATPEQPAATEPEVS